MNPEPFRSDERPVAAIFRSPVFNASETFVRLQAAALSRYQPLIVGLEDKGHVPPALAGRTVIATGAAEAFGIRAFAQWGRLAARVAEIRPALVHAHFGTDGLIALPLARRLNLPLIVTLHGYDVTRSRGNLLASGRLSWVRYGLFQRRLMRSGALFLTVSDALRHQAIALGFPAERTLTHYIGIDIGRFRAPASRGDSLEILHVGRLVEKKGAAVLLQALPGILARVPAARLTICGDGPLRPSLERLAAELGVADAVAFRGSVAPEELSAMLQTAAVLAAPSVIARSGDAEGLPTVIMEAAASGLPVVASDHSGIPEAVIDGETGFLVPEHDAAALARRIGDVLLSADLRRDMGAAGRRLVEHRFDAVRQTELLERHYDDVRKAAAARG